MGAKTKGRFHQVIVRCMCVSDWMREQEKRKDKRVEISINNLPVHGS